MAKHYEKTSLTDKEILGAFDQDLFPIINEIIASQEKKIQKIKSHLQAIAIAAKEDCHRVIMTEYYLSKELRAFIKNYYRNKRLLKMAQNPTSSGGMNFEMIQSAKDVPIESLYTFEKLRSTQARVSASCPFHEDKTPSFVIYKNQNRFHCFSCGAKGSAIDFMMQLHNLSFKDAVKKLS